MDKTVNLEMATKIVNELTKQMHAQIDTFSDNILKQIDSFDGNKEAKMKTFSETHQGPLFAEVNTRMYEFLKELKKIRQIKQNELSDAPEELQMDQLSRYNISPYRTMNTQLVINRGAVSPYSSISVPSNSVPNIMRDGITKSPVQAPSTAQLLHQQHLLPMSRVATSPVSSNHLNYDEESQSSRYNRGGPGGPRGRNYGDYAGLGRGAGSSRGLRLSSRSRSRQRSNSPIMNITSDQKARNMERYPPRFEERSQSHATNPYTNVNSNNQYLNPDQLRSNNSPLMSHREMSRRDQDINGDSPNIVRDPELVYSLPKQRLCKIFDFSKLIIFDRSGKQIFSEDFCLADVGKSSEKSKSPVRFSQYKDKLVFFVDRNSLCFIDASLEDLDPIYFRDDVNELVDVCIDEMENRFIVLNSKCTIYYKNYKTKFLSEDCSLQRKGELRGRAMTLSFDSYYLLVGYENVWQGGNEDCLGLRKKLDSGYYFPYSVAYLAGDKGKPNFFIFIKFEFFNSFC